MSSREKGSEQIYIDRVESDSPVYAVHHIIGETPDFSGKEHFNYAFTRPGLTGYLEGASVAPKRYEVEVIRGIPADVKNGHFPGFKLEGLASSEFAAIIEEAGLTGQGARSRVRIVL